MAPLTRLRRPRVRAFTLLEVLLAIALLGVLGALIATMWSQARDWTLENASAQRVLRLPRLTELLRTQWADRRATVGAGRASEAVRVGPGEVSFVTATPILFPEWPLVSATWRIVGDEDASTPDAERFRLDYEESPVTTFTDPDAEQADGAEGAADSRNRRQRLASESRATIEPRRIALLRGAEALALDRWGPAYRFEALSLRTTPLRQREGEPPEPEGPIPEGPDAWRPIEAQFQGVPPALRLSGTHEGKRFECTLIVGDSR